MTVKLLTEPHLEFLSLKGGCIGSAESIHVKIPHCWKSRDAAQLISLIKEKTPAITILLCSSGPRGDADVSSVNSVIKELSEIHS